MLWWYRNRVGSDQFTVPGYRKKRIFPDFVVQGQSNGKRYHRVLVSESKGEHLMGADRTAYTRIMASYFEKAGHRVTWQKLGSEFKDHIFRFQVLDEAQPGGRDWKDELNRLLALSD